MLNISGGRSLYDGYVVNDIYCEEGNEYIDFTSKPDIIALHHAIGDVNEDEYKRLQIRKTIEEHLDKELKLTPMGIKVLSLFLLIKLLIIVTTLHRNKKENTLLFLKKNMQKQLKTQI